MGLLQHRPDEEPKIHSADPPRGQARYLAEHAEEERLFNTGHQDVAYRHFLDWLGGLLSEEIGVLFGCARTAKVAA